MKAIYLNRYKDKIYFEDKGDSVEMTGYFDMGLRWGFKEDDKTVAMVDPSGGPYITLGSNLAMFFEDGKKRIVKEINLFEGKVEFIYK